MAKPVPPAEAQAQRSGSGENHNGFRIVALCRGNNLGWMRLQGSAEGGCNFDLQICSRTIEGRRSSLQKDVA
jgi:hypothetical protein